MPLYEYLCEACDTRFEVIHKFSDGPVETCKVCGKGPVQRLPSSPAIQFKGSGFYITDYAKKGSGDPASGKRDAKADGDSKAAGESKSAGDSKSEGGTKSETASKSESSSSPASTPAASSKE